MKRFTALRWLIVCTVLAGAGSVLTAARVSAATAPQRLVYNGHLLDAAGSAVTTAVTVRFSLWTSADLAAGDVSGTGAINTAAATYAGWKDAFTLTPDARGYFTVSLGSSVALPDFSTFSAADITSLHLQVEVKPAAGAATAYEVLDPNASDTATDRTPLLSVPFALNADLLDQRHVGTASGAIPVLSSGGLLNLSQAPSGTNRPNFILDADGSVSAGSLSLQFGGSLAKNLSYDIDNGRFNFDDDLRVQGNLTVTGLINGVDITAISSSADNSHLKVSTGAGLAVTVARGDYRLGGSVTQFTGTSGVVIADDATSNFFFTSTGLTVTTAGFPTDTMIIPLASVTAAGGAVTTVTDRRIFNSNDTQRTIAKVYEPQYEGAAFQGDGTNNVGQLTVSHSGGTLKNFYQWTSTRSTLQDYAILLRIPVSADFVRWGGTPLSLVYRTTMSGTGSNALSFQAFDTAGAAVTLTGSGTTNIGGTDWTTATWGFAGTPAWTAGGEMLLKITLKAKDNAAVQVGPLTVRYTDILSE